MTAPGFPAIGRTVPAPVLTGGFALVGVIAAWFAIGLSGWLVIALLFTVGGAALPRSPLTAALVALLACALVIRGDVGYSASFVVVLAASHLLVVGGSLLASLPWRARVQTAVLRRPLVRYVVVQLGAQIAAFVVLGIVTPASSTGLLWLAIVGAAAVLALALTVLVPLLLRPARA